MNNQNQETLYGKDMNAFLEVKTRYNAYREYERKKIISYLKMKGLKVARNGGMGIPFYTNGGKLNPSYDLTNWKWIVVSLDDKKALISLQAYDIDRRSKSVHVLMDRIGICAYSKLGREPEYLTEMRVTSYELPLGETELKGLYECVENAMNEVKTENCEAE